MFRVSLLALTASFALCLPVQAADDSAATDLARSIAERPANEGRVGTMNFRLVNADGAVRERSARMFHSDRDETVRIAIFFEAPAMIAETAFLSFDHAVSEDENWLYLPATDRVRRLPTSERGAWFMGTDLTYGDVKDNFKFGLEDWNFTLDAPETVDGKSYPVLVGTVRSPEIGMEIGYASFRARVDEASRFPVEIDFTDTDGDPLKTVRVERVEQVGGAWTAMRFTIDNLQTGHRTEVEFTGMTYVPDLDPHVFDPDGLAYGVPAIG